MYICVYMYIYVYTCINTYIIHTYINVHTCVCVCVCVCVCARIVRAPFHKPQGLVALRNVCEPVCIEDAFGNFLELIEDAFFFWRVPL